MLAPSLKSARSTSLRPFLASFTRNCAAILALVFTAAVSAEEKPSIGQTRIAQWKDDRTAAFLLMFDDSWPSHYQVAAPELAKRNMTATFYVCPGKGEYRAGAKEWEQNVWKMGMVYGVHTMTHKGVKDLENAEYEIGECANIIRRITPGKPDRLVSYAQPGVGPNDWNITSAQLDDLLKEHHLISRLPFTNHGAVYHMQTVDQMLALADKAIAGKGLEYLVIHGVERIKPDWHYQDMWALKQDIFLPLLDALKERSDKGQLWITDHISSHQYETERATAAVQVTEATPRLIRLELKSQADPKYYDLPLTLVTQVPADRKKASVTQGTSATTVDVVDGAIRFDAVPGGGEIRIKAE
jgi:peptidoglycan/xylan/chitin deacetylase (PgdA/CDA1 family)